VHLNRPRGFTILSILFSFFTLGSIAKGLRLSASYGIVPGVLSFVYGLAALAVVIGLWLCRPWAFYALIVWSISALLRIFNMQFGLNGDYTIPLHFFISYALILSILSILLLYYVKKEISRRSQNQPQLDAEGHPLNVQPQKEIHVFKSICYSYLIFLIISFINFAITIFFISRNLVPVAIFNTLLNLFSIYLLARYFIGPLKNKTIYITFWISSIVLSSLLIIPYGNFVLDYCINIFRQLSQNN